MDIVFSQWIHNTNVEFYLLMALCIVLMSIPFIGKYVRMLDTFFHEGGHALLSLLLGGQKININLFSDLSGLTTWKSTGNTFKDFLITAVGYPVSALASCGAFYLISHGMQDLFIGILCIVIFLFLLFHIRNGYGIFWCLTFIILNLFLIAKADITIINTVAYAYAFVMFLESIRSVLIIVKLAFTDSKHAGDATLIARIIHLPAALAAILFFAFNFFVYLYTIKHFFPFGEYITFIHF